MGLQLIIGLIVFRTPLGQGLFEAANVVIAKLNEFAGEGAGLVFGALGDGGKMQETFGEGVIFAIAIPATIIFVSALSSLLYHWRILPWVVTGIAWVMRRTMRTSGSETLATAANVFMGQTEAPLVVKPYIASMTRSELNALMTGGFATIAGSVLAVYLGLLGEEYGPHLLTASVMSAPAAFLMAKVMLPETEESPTGSMVELKIERTASNTIEAAANGTSDGLKLWLNVVAMLIAFMGLVALVDWCLAVAADNRFWALDGGLSLNRIFSWVFSPFAWMMGVEGWHDCQLMGSLLGTKIAVNEFIAFNGMLELLGGTGDATFHSPRTAKMAAYALCGFANFASIGIQIGGISPLAPERKPLIAKLALRAMLGGAFASWMTATVAGMFIE